jgi:dihydrofolate reductase
MSLIASDFITLDGVVQAPGGPEEDTDGGFVNGGWSFPYFDEEVMGPVFDDSAKTTAALLFGRRTWEVMAGAWPERAGDPFADHMNSVSKYVASRTLTQEDLNWNNSHLLPSEDIASSVSEMKATIDGDIQILGSSELVRYLVGHDLVDEFSLMVHPLIVGGGKRLFPDDGVARKFELKDVKPTSTGVLIVNYTKASSP